MSLWSRIDVGNLRMTSLFAKYKKISTPTAQCAGEFLKGSVTRKARSDRVHAPLEGFPLHLRKPRVRTQCWNQQSERIKSSVGF